MTWPPSFSLAAVAPRELSSAGRRLPLLGVYEPSFDCVNIVGKVAGWFDDRIREFVGPLLAMREGRKTKKPLPT